MMLDDLLLLTELFRTGVRRRSELVAENLLLRHQLAVLTRPTRKRPRLPGRPAPLGGGLPALARLAPAPHLRRLGPWRDATAVARTTAEWVAWWNARRLHGALGHVPPAEEEDEAAHRPAPAAAVV